MDFEKRCTTCRHHDLIYKLDNNNIDNGYIYCWHLDQNFDYEQYNCDCWELIEQED